MNAPRRFVIPNPLPSTLSFRIRARPPCHSESAPVHLVIPNPLQRCQYTRPCTLSFRIRFSGEESAFPANRFRKRGVPRVSPLLRRWIPALIETDSCQGTPSQAAEKVTKACCTVVERRF